MKLLAWDCSSRSTVIAALEWKEGELPVLVSEWTLEMLASHSEKLLWAVHQVLEAAKWKIADIDVFGVGVGPGSFTGLRIGLTTARTLAHTLGKPLVGVSSLAALVRPVARTLAFVKSVGTKALVIGANDAAKGEFYAIWGSAKNLLDCTCKADGDFGGLWKRGVDEDVMLPENLLKVLNKRLLEVKKPVGSLMQWVAIGDAVERYPDLWKELPADQKIELPQVFSSQIQGRFLGQLVWETYQAGLVRSALQVRPRYLRASDAEINLKAGKLKVQPSGDPNS